MGGNKSKKGGEGLLEPHLEEPDLKKQWEVGKQHVFVSKRRNNIFAQFFNIREKEMNFQKEIYYLYNIFFRHSF
jgi:hypothetical protein